MFDGLQFNILPSGYINIHLRLYTTIFHNSEKLQHLFSA